VRPRLRPRVWPHPPASARPARLTQSPATWPSCRGRGPRSRPAPWSGAGPWGSGCCCCSAPRCPRGRAPRKVPTPALAAHPPQPPAGARIPEEALLPAPHSRSLPGFARVARLSIGQANLCSLTPKCCTPGPVPPIPLLLASKYAWGWRGIPHHCQEAAPPLLHLGPFFCPTQKSGPSKVRGGKRPLSA
jgi:hypothetical protein